MKDPGAPPQRKGFLLQRPNCRWGRGIAQHRPCTADAPATPARGISASRSRRITHRRFLFAEKARTHTLCAGGCV
eukprot:7473130-Pyramimonas_sp.AAC.1